MRTAATATTAIQPTMIDIIAQAAPAATGITGNTAPRTGLSLTNGQIYFVTVRATSGTGAQVSDPSDGVTIDTSGPVAGVVSDGTGSDIAPDPPK